MPNVSRPCTRAFRPVPAFTASIRADLTVIATAGSMAGLTSGLRDSNTSPFDERISRIISGSTELPLLANTENTAAISSGVTPASPHGQIASAGEARLPHVAPCRPRLSTCVVDQATATVLSERISAYAAQPRRCISSLPGAPEGLCGPFFVLIFMSRAVGRQPSRRPPRILSV